MDLKSMLLPEKAVEFDFPGCPGLKFTIAFLSKESNQKLLKKCQKTKYDSRTRAPIEELDDDLFYDQYTAAIIKGWTGFKFKYMDEFVLGNFSEFNPEDEMEYSHENAVVLMKESTALDTWVNGVLQDLTNFTKISSKSSSKE